MQFQLMGLQCNPTRFISRDEREQLDLSLIIFLSDCVSYSQSIVVH